MKIKVIIIVILLIVFYFTKTYNTEINEYPVIDNAKMVTFLYEDKTFIVPLDEYILNVLACEMPASFNNDALKAEAIAIRTYYLYKESKNKNYVASNSDQCYISNDKLKEKWKNNYDFYYDKLKKIVYETKNKYLTYNNEIVLSLYFSLSNGYTESSKDVFNVDLPYLITVYSVWDKNLKNYENVVEISKNDFLDELGIKGKDIFVELVSQTDGKSIKEININGHLFKGTEVRKLLNLKSTDFTLDISDEIIKITTKGYGHGVGMSQYGANEMAKNNYTYEEILKHYYPGTEISNINV